MLTAPQWQWQNCSIPAATKLEKDLGDKLGSFDRINKKNIYVYNQHREVSFWRMAPTPGG